MSDFKREARYHVCKVKDADKYLTQLERRFLMGILCKLNAARVGDGKRSLITVCVDDDWPEYEKVWEMIESRCAEDPTQ